jgi:hypothetical protein
MYGLREATRHDRCHAGTCRKVVICSACQADTWVQYTHGRWDDEARDGRGATAMPFDPVAVTLACGHTFGDLAAAHPTTPAHDPAEVPAEVPGTAGGGER